MAIALSVALLSAAGCAPSHFAQEDPDWGYEPPEFVSEEDRKACEARALSAARSRSSEVTSSGSVAEGVAAWGGVLGFTGVILFLRGEEEEAYGEGYDACLRDKSYEID